ncbi:MAG TPA: acyltransferase [Solirubrobacteraceae bacterium]|nr:acyltransferase [Solirubrobacteraceae bacterium]
MSVTASPRARLAGLDGLRALAAIAVLTYHVAEWSGFSFAGPFASVLWELKGGVAVFFVISGTVLYLPYARAIRDQDALPDWRRYARRRVVRIVPAYWLALTACALGPFSAGVLGPGLWRYYGLSQIYSSDTLLRGLGGAWSLCVEVSFYAVLPVLALIAACLARRAGPRLAPRAQVVLVGAMAVVSIALRWIVAGSLIAPAQGHGLSLTVALPGFLDWFAIGMGLAVFAAQCEAGRACCRPLAALSCRPGACVVLGLLAFIAGVPAQQADMFLPWYGLLTHLALGVGSAFLVLAAIGPPRTRQSRSWAPRLNGRSLTWLGTISYGIYLWNRLVLQLIHRQPEPRGLLGTIVIWLIVMGATIALAAVSWYLVERPLQRALRASENRVRGGGRSPILDAGVQSVTERLNSPGVAVDHLA